MAESTDQKEAFAMTEAAAILGITFDEVFDAVFSRRMPSIESPTGRRLVPREAVEAWRRQVEGTR